MIPLKSNLKKGLLLVLNLGSSSLKFSLFHSDSLETECNGLVEGMYTSETIMEITGNGSKRLIKKLFKGLDFEICLVELVNWLEESPYRAKITAIGYRVVQGGPKHITPEKVTSSLLADLETYIYLAPNHLPDEIKLIRYFRNAFIGIPHFACFDTNFHKDMPEVAKFYPLPDRFREMGLRRYGFHGLSCESILQQLLEEDVDVAHQKIVIAHLGSGSSITAIKNGVGIDTTMGISPLGGLVMATRPGDIDPGAILFMLKQEHLSVEQLDRILSDESGLKAIAGISDMKEILATQRSCQKSSEALDLFCYQAKKHLGSLVAVLGGIDLLVFCGGIGENVPLIREEVCAHMEFLGINIDAGSNTSNDTIISRSNSKVTVRVMKTDEEYMIGMHTQNLLII